MEFLNSLKERLRYHKFPFDHWELDRPLTKDAINEICNTQIADLTKMKIIFCPLMKLVYVLYHLLMIFLERISN